jgi:hypothetical protein
VPYLHEDDLLKASWQSLLLTLMKLLEALVMADSPQAMALCDYMVDKAGQLKEQVSSRAEAISRLPDKQE